jgi:hypothetical protein
LLPVTTPSVHRLATRQRKTEPSPAIGKLKANNGVIMPELMGNRPAANNGNLLARLDAVSAQFPSNMRPGSPFFVLDAVMAP